MQVFGHHLNTDKRGTGLLHIIVYDAYSPQRIYSNGMASFRRLASSDLSPDGVLIHRFCSCFAVF